MDEMKHAIVCIDDDPLILQMLSFQLHKFIESETTLMEFYTNPSLALQDIDQLVSDNIDIIFIIVDYQMPELNGAEFIRRIKMNHTNLKCIMLSGQANAIQVDDLVNDNLLDSFISKPWNEEDLIRAITPILDERDIILNIR
jgi:CheY-like chemotaxis protein